MTLTPLDLLKEVLSYLTELASGFLNISLLLLDFMGIVLLFWPGFRWAQITGLLTFALSFGIANFRIYRKHRQLLKATEPLYAKRVFLLESLQEEIKANVTNATDREFFGYTDDTWGHHRDDVYWLPHELRNKLIAHYNALQLLMDSIHDGIDGGWISRIETWFPSDEAGRWLDRTDSLSESFLDVSQNLLEGLQGLIEQLEHKND